MSNNLSDKNYAILVFASPSGGGKNTIINRIRAVRPIIEYSISATTRPQGNGEIDGQHYHFVSHERFEQMILGDELIEFEQVHGLYYGTPRWHIDDVISRGGAVTLDLDVKGALHMKKLYPFATLFFLLPPSIEILRQRLLKRRRESAEKIESRLKAAQNEIAFAPLFDYQIVNDDLDTAVAEVLAIVDKQLDNLKI